MSDAIANLRNGRAYLASIENWAESTEELTESESKHCAVSVLGTDGVAAASHYLLAAMQSIGLDVDSCAAMIDYNDGNPPYDGATREERHERIVALFDRAILLAEIDEQAIRASGPRGEAREGVHVSA